MGALDRLPENALTRVITEQREDAAAIKAAQTFGSGSVLTSRVFSADAYDAVMTPTGSRHLHRIDVEFIPDDMTFGGALCHRLEVKAMTSAGVVTRDGGIIQRRFSVDNRQRWSIYKEDFGSASDLRRLKFYFFTTGSGTFTSTIVN